MIYVTAGGNESKRKKYVILSVLINWHGTVDVRVCYIVISHLNNAVPRLELKFLYYVVPIKVVNLYVLLLNVKCL